MTNILEIKREQLFAATTREESDASLALGGKSLIDRAEVTAAGAKIRLLQDGRRFEMTWTMAQPLHAMRGSL